MNENIEELLAFMKRLHMRWGADAAITDYEVESFNAIRRILSAWPDVEALADTEMRVIQCKGKDINDLGDALAALRAKLEK